MVNEKEDKQAEESPAPTEDVGSESETTPLIDGANLAAERLEKANEKQGELLQKQEELMAKQALAGRAEAGVGAGKEKEQTPEEYSNEVLEGRINPLE